MSSVAFEFCIRWASRCVTPHHIVVALHLWHAFGWALIWLALFPPLYIDCGTITASETAFGHTATKEKKMK
jgi:hypothetical protein